MKNLLLISALILPLSGCFKTTEMRDLAPFVTASVGAYCAIEEKEKCLVYVDAFGTIADKMLVDSALVE